MIKKIQHPMGKNSGKNLQNITLQNRKKLKTNKETDDFFCQIKLNNYIQTKSKFKMYEPN